MVLLHAKLMIAPDLCFVNKNEQNRAFLIGKAALRMKKADVAKWQTQRT
jgi:hypothetical protein